jgi:hypothetical protein
MVRARPKAMAMAKGRFRVRIWTMARIRAKI